MIYDASMNHVRCWEPLMAWIRLHDQDPNNCFECGEIPGEDGVAAAYFGMYMLNNKGERFVDPHDCDRAASYGVIMKLRAPMPIHRREAGLN